MYVYIYMIYKTDKFLKTGGDVYPMKKRTKILIIFVVLLALILALICWQYHNIKMAYYSYKYDNTQIENLIHEQNRGVNSYLDEHKEYNVRPPTELEQKLHQNELLTEDEFVDILTGKTTVKDIFGFDVQLNEKKDFANEENGVVSREELSQIKAETAPEKKPESPPAEEPPTEENSAEAEPTPTSPPEKTDSNQEASACIAKMYVLKSTFESELDKLYQEAVAYYGQMSAEQRKNAASLMVKQFYSRATGLERQCDAQVDELMTNLTASLEASGGDTSIVKKMRQAYSEEKSLKKSYYLNLVK